MYHGESVFRHGLVCEACFKRSDLLLFHELEGDLLCQECFNEAMKPFFDKQLTDEEKGR